MLRRGVSALLALGIAVAVFVVDQGIKSVVEGSMRVGQSIPLIPDFLSLTHIKNEGGAFGILGGSQTLLLIGSAVAVIVVLSMLLTGEPSRLTSWACGLILGGAAGNLLDRLMSGEVTDYVHFSFWYIFNAADTAIVAGVTLLLISSLLPTSPKKPSSNTSEAQKI